jgi:hypothetical protein
MMLGNSLEEVSESNNTHTPRTGKCGFCGITTIHTSVLGFLYLKDGRLIRKGGECEWQVFESSTR